MEKRSQYYLTEEARGEVQQLYFGPSWSDFRQGLFDYAEERKRKLVILTELQDKRGLLTSLKRFGQTIDFKTHGFTNKAVAWFRDTLSYVSAVDRIVETDLGKIGSH